MLKQIKNKKAIGMIPIIIGTVLIGVITVPITEWYLSVNSSVNNIESRLDAMTVATSEWNRINSMSTEDIEAKKSELTNYKVGDYDVSVILGTKGKMLDSTCVAGATNEDKATCYKDSTITVKKDNETLYSSKLLPLVSQPSFYSKSEVDEKLNAYVKNESYDPVNKKNKVSVRYEKNALSGDYLLNDYIDGQLIESSSNVAIIYPRGSKTSPGILHASEWVEIPNPFPGYYVSVEVHIYVAGRWTPPGYARIQTTHREGTVTLQKDANTIVVWAREDVACTCGGYIPNEYTNLASAPFRVIVTKLGKYEL